MGRPEKPIVTSNVALRELMAWLREQRRRTGQTYRGLSARAGLHPTTLQRAASGECVPKLFTVRAYARACDASPEYAKALWRKARYEETRARRGGRSLSAPPPSLIRDHADLSVALLDLYEKAGSPALRILEKRAGGYGILPRSTAYRIVNRQVVPHSPAQFEAFLRACEVPEADRQEWKEAWARAWRREKQTEAAAEVVPEPALRRVLQDYAGKRLTVRIHPPVTPVRAAFEDPTGPHARRPARARHQSRAPARAKACPVMILE
jgi:transcriptional regulator with XRE-family HTH domain